MGDGGAAADGGGDGGDGGERVLHRRLRQAEGAGEGWIRLCISKVNPNVRLSPHAEGFPPPPAHAGHIRRGKSL